LTTDFWGKKKKKKTGRRNTRKGKAQRTTPKKKTQAGGPTLPKKKAIHPGKKEKGGIKKGGERNRKGTPGKGFQNDEGVLKTKKG